MLNSLSPVVAGLMAIFLLSSTLSLHAQKRDSLTLSCLLREPLFHKEKPAIDLGLEEPKIILSSATDTVVRAPADVIISTITRTADGQWEIVFSKKDYWFWLTGVSKVLVRKDQKLKAGDPLGVLTTGEQIELLLYDFETPLDPRRYMKCAQ